MDDSALSPGSETRANDHYTYRYAWRANPYELSELSEGLFPVDSSIGWQWAFGKLSVGYGVRGGVKVYFMGLPKTKEGRHSLIRRLLQYSTKLDSGTLKNFLV